MGYKPIKDPNTPKPIKTRITSNIRGHASFLISRLFGLLRLGFLGFLGLRLSVCRVTNPRTRIFPNLRTQITSNVHGYAIFLNSRLFGFLGLGLLGFFGYKPKDPNNLECAWPCKIFYFEIIRVLRFGVVRFLGLMSSEVIVIFYPKIEGGG